MHITGSVKVKNTMDYFKIHDSHAKDTHVFDLHQLSGEFLSSLDPFHIWRLLKKTVKMTAQSQGICHKGLSLKNMKLI